MVDQRAGANRPFAPLPSGQPRVEMGALPLPTPLPAQPAETIKEKQATTARTIFNISCLLNGGNSLYCTSGITSLLPVKARVLRRKLKSLVLKSHTGEATVSTSYPQTRPVTDGACAHARARGARDRRQRLGLRALRRRRGNSCSSAWCRPGEARGAAIRRMRHF